MYSKELIPTFSLENSKKFVDDLNKEALKHRALNHPYLQKLKDGSFKEPVAALKDFGYQYLAYSVDFLRYLTATISQLNEREHREWLIGNLMEESGRVDEDEAEELQKIGVDISWVQGVPHPVLYMRYLNAIGMDENFRAANDYCDEAKVWRRMFLNICTSGGAAQALGAMGLGTENIVKYIYAPILDAIKTHLDITPKDRVFFDLHALLDDEHGQILDNIAVEYAQFRRNREPLRDGMLMALNLRTAFFDAMMVRAEENKFGAPVKKAA